MGRYHEEGASKAAEFVPWKPDRCADCGEHWPTHSKDGREGPWRCAACDAVAKPKPPEDPFADRERDKPPDPVQGSLL